jgi:hypothetical protein
MVGAEEPVGWTCGLQPVAAWDASTEAMRTTGKTKPREGVGIEAGLHQPQSRMGGDGALDKPSAARETTRATTVRMLCPC